MVSCHSGLSRWEDVRARNRPCRSLFPEGRCRRLRARWRPLRRR